MFKLYTKARSNQYSKHKHKSLKMGNVCISGSEYLLITPRTLSESYFFLCVYNYNGAVTIISIQKVLLKALENTVRLQR